MSQDAATRATNLQFGLATIGAARDLTHAKEEERNVSVHLPVDIAEALIAKAGWVVEQRPTPKKKQREGWDTTYPVFLGPDGLHVWERDEALTLALFQLTLDTFKAGDFVMHHSDKTGEVEEWEVIGVEAGGLNLEDEDGGKAWNVKPSDCTQA